VRALAVPQLAPELAEEVARARAVVFADACPGPGPARLVPLTAGCHSVGLGHACDPAWLLGLTAALYGRRPAAWLLALPAVRFDFGAALSPEAERGVGQGLDVLAGLDGGGPCTRSG
jgi:Ni,Fe-hydrogenase maturation factor